jgi:RimJ/RimL family protein N-acetyltransferase
VFALITFKPMTEVDLPYWDKWVEMPQVKSTWFQEGYETTDYIYQKIKGNGYDFPFIVLVDDKPIGYIQCSDLYAYSQLCQAPKGLFIHEGAGTFGMDLFIGEEDYLHKGYGTKIVEAFVKKIFEEFSAKLIYIDPDINNKTAIRCYEKAGFMFERIANDGVADCYVMNIQKPLGK